MHFIKSAALATLAASLVSAIDIIGIKDRHFVNEKTGEKFFMKGVDYQPGGSAAFKSGSDPLSDPEICARDIFLFQQLGINTIRVYSVDPYLNHDECMTMLAAAGIYLVLDVNSPLEHQHLYDMEPWTTYTPMYLKHIFEVVEVFSGYDNVLAFLSGNEVVHTKGSEKRSPGYIKAVTRDLKNYIKKNIHRKIPVGYSNADHLEFRVSLAEFLACGKEGSIDFFAINSYQWCGENTFEGSGYDQLVEHYGNYTLPVFFSEYGCNEVRPRIFQETAALYSDKMTGVFSGGLIYEFTQEKNDYGIVQVASNKKDIQIMKEFDTLAKVHKAVKNPVPLPAEIEVFERPTECQDADYYWNINGNNTLPASLGEEYIKKGVEVASDGDVKWVRGKFIDIEQTLKETSYTIKDSSGKEIKNKKIGTVAGVEQGPIVDPTGTDVEDDDSAAVSVKTAFGTVVAAVVAAVFATL